tara:strand:+ start:1528 stop:2379 length:852 start_codon:yes stop_codon:yes gene_type:complete
MTVLNLIGKITPIYNNFKSSSSGLEQMILAWNIGAHLNEYINKNNIKPHALYRQIYGKSEGSDNIDKKSYIPREFQGRCLRIHKIFDSHESIQQTFPSLVSFTSFRECMPFFDNPKYKFKGKDKDNLIALLNSNNSASKVMIKIRVLLKKHIGISNPRTQKLDEVNEEKQTFIDYYNNVYHLQKNDLEQTKKILTKNNYTKSILLDIASSTDALAEDGIKYSVINHDGSNDLVWAKYINLLKSFSIDKNPKRIRRFRRVIETRRIVQLSRMLITLADKIFSKD